MILHNDWQTILSNEFEQPYMKELFSELKVAYQTTTVYPPREKVFSAFNLTPYSEVKVVILGQDPYHGPHQANGLSFSVEKGTPLPPSLRNIFTELVDDMGCSYPQNGDLSKWARQGVLLLNTTLTVKQATPMSHVGMGWERFTDQVLRLLDQKSTPIVFILWGKHARNKAKFINQSHHLIIESAHPSPLSAYRGFFGSHPFSRTNHFLVSHGINPINWSLT